MITRLKYSLTLIITFASLWLGADCFQNTPMAMPPVERIELSNGLVVLISEEHTLPFVTLQLLIDAGSWRDPRGQEGLANLTAEGMLLGTATHSVNAVNEALDFMGSSLDASCGKDYATLRLQTLKKELDKGFELFMSALTQPAFPEDELNREIEKLRGAIQAEEDQPGEVADKAFEEALFQSSPYGHPVEGTRESLAGINREAVLEFYRGYYFPNHAILAIVGDITKEEFKTKLAPRLEQWPAGKAPKMDFNSDFVEGPKQVVIDRPVTQANIVLGHEGVSRDNKDYYAIAVMNYILGNGGFASRLVEEIRIKRGLAYSVASVFIPRKQPGSFQVMVQTKNASAREAIALTIEQMERIQNELVSEQELKMAKDYLIGSFPMRFDTQGELTHFLTQVEYYGLGLDYPDRYPAIISAITREDVQRAAKTYLQPKESIQVIVTNKKEAGLD